MPDPVTVLDAEGIVLDINKAATAAYRPPLDEIIGKPIHVLNPELPRDHLNPVWETLNRGETYVIEATNMRADGTRFPVEVHSAGFDHDGRKCIVAVARDLSGRREAEMRYHELMETIDQGILVLDVNGRMVHANATTMRLFGIRRRRGRRSAELASDRHAAGHYRAQAGRRDPARAGAHRPVDRVAQP